MEVNFLMTESLGLRSTACVVKFSDFQLFIDPSFSVTPKRFGLPPHELELEKALGTRRIFDAEIQKSDVISFSHYHFDHIPRFDFNPLEFNDRLDYYEIMKGKTVWAKSPDDKINYNQKLRADEIFKKLGKAIHKVDGKDFGKVRFSKPIFHGEENTRQGWILCAICEEEGSKFIHASDCQAIYKPSVEMLISEKPDLLWIGGPPAYLGQVSRKLITAAVQNLCFLAEKLPQVIIDHHLIRGSDFQDYLKVPKEIAKSKGHKICTTAEFLGQENNFFETERPKLWNQSK